MLICNYLKISTKSDPAGIRTQDPYIKSVMLYRLSYGIKRPVLKKKHIQILNLRNQFYDSLLDAVINHVFKRIAKIKALLVLAKVLSGFSPYLYSSKP